MSPKNKSIRIALIAIATTVLTIWGFHFLKGSDLLSRMNSYYAVYDKIEGLQTSAPITIKGYKVGLVGEISYNQAKGGILLVELEINPEIKLPKGTVARIFTSDLMSGKSVSLELGHSQDYFAPGDTLPSKVEKDLMEEVNAQVAPLKARVEKIMLSFDSVLVGFQAILNEKTRENLIHSIQSISLTLNTIDRIANQVDGLVTTEKGKLSKILSNIEGISATFSQNSQNISTIIQNFHLISDSLAKANIAGTILKTEETLSQTARLLEKINKGEGTAGKLLNDNQLYNNLEASSRNLDELIRDMKTNPKRYINFSVFDFNRSTDSNKSKGTKSINKESSIADYVYRVQLIASSKELHEDFFPDSLSVEWKVENGLNKYSTGSFLSQHEALSCLRKMKQKYPDAFIVRYELFGNDGIIE